MRTLFLCTCLALIAGTGNCSAETSTVGGEAGSFLSRVGNQTYNLQSKGKPIDLSGYHLTFDDEFDKMSVTGDTGAGPWYSPVHTDFGGSKFRGPQKDDGPVLVRDGNLVIQLYNKNRKWISSNVQSLNSRGQGFAQKYGYFEMRAKFPPGKGVWCGIWLHSSKYFTDTKLHQTEIDIVEAYGATPLGMHSTVHLWPAPSPTAIDGKTKWGKGFIAKVPGMFEDFHTYGVDISPDWITFYYDRKETGRIATMDEVKTPLYILVTLALLPKTAKLQPHSVQEMLVDYVKVWQNPAYR